MLAHSNYAVLKGSPEVGCKGTRKLHAMLVKDGIPSSGETARASPVKEILTGVSGSNKISCLLTSSGTLMDTQEKKTLSEADIKAKFITPAIVSAGWNEVAHICREVTLTPGPVVVRGNLSSRNRKKRKFADYVLQKEKGVPVAVIEAKDNNHTISDGLQQGLGYADLLDVPSAFSSNGDGFASHNKTSAPGEDIETEFGLGKR